MTRLIYETDNGRLSVQVPRLPSAGEARALSGDGGSVPSPLALAHHHLAHLIESVPTIPTDGVWSCEGWVH